MYVKATKVACSVKEATKVAWAYYVKWNRNKQTNKQKKNRAQENFARENNKTGPITDDLDIIADATDSKCGIVLLMRKHNARPNPDINDVSSCIEVTTTEHTETPKSIYDLVDEYKYFNSNWEEYDHDFI